MDGSNVKEVFTTVAQNHLKIQNEVNNITSGTEGSTAHTGNSSSTAERTGGKKFDLEKQKENTGKKGRKCCGGSG